MNDAATVLTAMSLVISALTPIMLAVISRRQAARAAAAADKVEGVKQDLAVQSQAIAEKVETIHVAVNSERTKMLEKLEALHQEVAGLRADNATLVQRAKKK